MVEVDLPLHPSQQLFIVLIISLAYCVFMITFYFLVITDQFETLLTDKLQVLILTGQRSPDVRTALLDLVINNCSQLAPPDQVGQAYNTRMRINLALMQSMLMPYVYVLFGLLVGVCIWNWRKRVWSFPWTFLTLTAIQFTPDLIFYFVVIRRWVFIGDWTIVWYLIDH